MKRVFAFATCCGFLLTHIANRAFADSDGPKPAPAGGVVITPMPGATAKPGEAKPGEAKPGDKPAEAKKEEKKEDAKPTVAPITRPAEPKKPANPEELKVRPADDGKITFSFNGQPWTSVLEWLADISQMSLEWQEIPGGFVNLSTRGRYTVPEVRDMLNSILLARGYTLLTNGEVLIVSPLKDLNVSIVPRVEPAALEDRGRHELVRVSFDLKRLRAEDLVEELKPVLSSYGKISAMKTTNRLDVVDTARTLLRIRELLAEEQDSSGQSQVLRRFKLQYTRAEDVAETLKPLLGIAPPAQPAMSPQQMQQMQQMQMQQMQQQAQQQGGKPPVPAAGKPEIYLAVDKRENLILASATPDKLALIEQAIAYLDVPQAASGSLLEQVGRVQVYRLVSVAPEPIVKTLRDLGNLDPATRLDVDAENRTIIANASLADHVTIRALIDRVDGSARKMEVIQLRKLDAEYVAGSIEFLMRGPEKENKQQSRYYYYESSYSSRSQQKEEEKDKFQVEADTENNRLLLRANTIELEEIRQLLVKLGELRPDGRPDTMRVIAIPPGKERDQLLEKLRKLWPSLGPNELEVEEDKSTEKKVGEPSKTPASAPARKTEGKDRLTRTLESPVRASLTGYELAQAEEGAAPWDNEPTSIDERRERAAAARPERKFSAPPVTITQGERGLIVTSNDPEALDRLMQLVDEMTADDSAHHIFELKHVFAEDVADLLDSVFDTDSTGKDKSASERRIVYYYDGPPADKKEARGRLNKRRPLKFVPDAVTNTILVQGANEDQLREIKQLIDLYDRGDEPDSKSVRKTQMVVVKYGNAAEIADVIKDVYRDLLSPTDKALANNQQQQQKEKEPRPYYSYYDFPEGQDDSNKESMPRFKGLLSVGVEKRTNTIVVSAPAYLLENVLHMIDRIDESSRPLRSVTRVVHSSAVHDPNLRKALDSLATPTAPAKTDAPGGNPMGQPGMNGQQQGQPQQNGAVTLGN